MHKYCDPPPRITPDRKTCLPWKENWHKVDSIKNILARKGLSNRINEKCSKADVFGNQKCTFDDEIFYDFMKLGWAQDTEDGKAGICGLIDRPVSECIQSGLRILIEKKNQTSIRSPNPEQRDGLRFGRMHQLSATL